MATTSAPVRGVGRRNSSGRPSWRMFAPVRVRLPVPTGESRCRSLIRFCAFVLPAGSKYRPTPPRTTVLPSLVAVQAKPKVGERFPFCAAGGLNPSAPRMGVRSAGFVKSWVSAFGSYRPPQAVVQRQARARSPGVGDVQTKQIHHAFGTEAGPQHGRRTDGHGEAFEWKLPDLLVGGERVRQWNVRRVLSNAAAEKRA